MIFCTVPNLQTVNYQIMSSICPMQNFYLEWHTYDCTKQQVFKWLYLYINSKVIGTYFMELWAAKQRYQSLAADTYMHYYQHSIELCLCSLVGTSKLLCIFTLNACLKILQNFPRWNSMYPTSSFWESECFHLQCGSCKFVQKYISFSLDTIVTS